MCRTEREIKDATESNTNVFCLDLLLPVRGAVNFNLLFTTSVAITIYILQNFRSWEVTSHCRPPIWRFILQPIRYAGACSSYECFILRAVRHNNKLRGQGYIKKRLNSSLRKLYRRYVDFISNIKFPSPECYTTFWSDILHWSDITPS